MNQNDIINTVMKMRNIRKSEVADVMGYKTRQQFSEKMMRMTIKTNEMIDMLEKMDYKIVLEDQRNGDMVHIISEKIGPTIRTYTGGNYRNTNKCVSFGTYMEDGKLHELFQDTKDGAYLMAIYGKDLNRLSQISKDAFDLLIQEKMHGE